MNQRLKESKKKEQMRTRNRIIVGKCIVNLHECCEVEKCDCKCHDGKTIPRVNTINLGNPLTNLYQDEERTKQ